MRTLLAVLGLCFAVPAEAQTTPLPLEQRTWDQRIVEPGSHKSIAIESQPCCNGPSGASTDRREQEVLAAQPHRAARQGDVLRLSLAGGRTLKLTNCLKEAECGHDDLVGYRLVGLWSTPRARYYIIDFVGYEIQAGFLIRDSDGQMVMLAAAALPSPDGRFAIAWHPSVIDGPIMELIDTKPTPPKVDRTLFPPRCPGHDTIADPGLNPVWTNDKNVAFEGSTFFGEQGPKFRMTLRDVGEPSQRWECQF